MQNLKRQDTEEFIYKPESDDRLKRTNLWLLEGTINAGEGVEKRDPSYSVGGNAN